MIEIIKIILEVVRGGINYSDFNLKKKKADLGVKLFLVYIHLNNILVTGRDITSSLKVYVSRMGEHLENNNDAYAMTAGKWIDYEIVKQRVNIAEFALAVRELNSELQILDGESYRKIIPLISGKLNALDSLLKVLGNNKLPLLGPTIEELKEVGKLGSGIFEPTTEENYRKNRKGIWEIKNELREKYEKVAIDLDRDWDEEIYNQVTIYFEERNPEKILDEIEEVLKNLRASIEKNFSTGDILLEVGKSGFDDRYNGDFFL